MSVAAVNSPCPRCGRSLRIPTDWINETFRCKHCRQAVVAIKKPKATTPLPMPGALPPLPTLPAGLPTLPGQPTAPPMLPTGYGLPAVSGLPTLPQGYPPGYGAPGMNVAPPLPAVPQLPGMPVPATPSSGLDFESSEGTLKVPSALRGKKNPGWGKTVALLGILIAIFGGGGAAAWVFVIAPNMKQEAESKLASSETSDVPTTASAFPRRLMVVSVNNYLYANPLSSGAEPVDAIQKLGHDVKSFSEKLADHLQIPKTQTYLLTDGVPSEDARPPLKPVVEMSVSRFLGTSRKQDRIVLVFTGHAIEIDNEPYLVPLEGELGVKESLIPLKWFYDQLGACPAQQKIFVVDVCRYDPGRGNERPDGGPMGEHLDRMLANPPPGVQVWSSCVKDQYSYEYDYQARRARGVDIQIKGSTFLNLFFYGTILGNKAGIQRPDDPIKIDAYAEPVNEFTVKAIKDIQKKDQTPRLVGTVAGEQVAFNAQEPSPQRIEIPRPIDIMPKGVAEKSLVRSLLNDVAVPPLKYARSGEEPVPLENVLPFAADVMSKFEEGAMSEEDVLKQEDKYPIRAMVVRAAQYLREVRSSAESKQLPEDLRGAATDGLKKDLAELQSRTLAKIQYLIKEHIDEMEAADLETEKSPRWRANFEYILAQLKTRFAYTYEYNYMFAKIRKDELPPLDPEAQHNGWRLSSRAEPQSGGEAKELARDSQRMFEKIASKYAGTPWAVLAKRDQMTAIGMQWEPTRFE